MTSYTAFQRIVGTINSYTVKLSSNIYITGADTGGAPPLPESGGSTVCARAASRNYNWTIYSK